MALLNTVKILTNEPKWPTKMVDMAKLTELAEMLGIFPNSPLSLSNITEANKNFAWFVMYSCASKTFVKSIAVVLCEFHVRVNPPPTKD